MPSACYGFNLSSHLDPRTGMLFSPGDIIDLYYRFARNRRIINPFGRAFMSNTARTATWWNTVASSGTNWWDVPDVVARWNRMISNDASEPYMRHVGNRHVAGNSAVRLLSVGCGTGSKEIAIAGLWPLWHITAIDISASRIAAACRAARATSARNVEFKVGTIGGSFDTGTFDVVLFDSSLHHFGGIDRVLSDVAALLTGSGVLVINEYVGPDRFQWTGEQLSAANRLFRSIPSAFRRRISGAVKNRIYRPGYLRMVLSDPSEAIESSKILPALHRHFSKVEETALGGNLLHLVLKDIAHHFVEPDAATQEILEELIEEENRFIADTASDFVFGVYRRK
jgi:SAM-dependent methyltransferase